MELNGAKIIIKLLERQGITQIAGIPGGSNLPIYGSLNESPITHILTHRDHQVIIDLQKVFYAA